MCHVVLDTNVFFPSFDLESVPLRVLSTEAQRGRFRIFVPEIVIDETVNLYREILESRFAKLNSSIRELQSMRALEEDVEAPQVTIHSAESAFRDRLRNWIARSDGEVVPYPKSPHKYVVDRALQRRKPFDDKGRAGYRDALIWENIRELVGPADLAFVTNNHTDFAAKGPDRGQTDAELELHKHLLSEIHSDQPGQSIRLFTTVHALNQALIPPDVAAEHDLRQLLSPAGPLAAQIRDALETAFDPYMSLDDGDAALTNTFSFDDPRLVAIYGVLEFELITARPLDDQRTAFYLEAVVDAEIDVSIYYADYYSLSDREARNLSIRPLNDHYVSATLNEPVRLSCEGILNTLDNRIEKLTAVSGEIEPTSSS